MSYKINWTESPLNCQTPKNWSVWRKMEISIIIPVYNRAQLLERTLRSVVKQSYRPLHVILIDNGSTDDSMSLLQRFKQEQETDGFRVSVGCEEFPGATSARNKGLDFVDTEWVMFFDSDDEMRPELVARNADAIRHSPTTDIFYIDVEIRSASGTTVVKWAPSPVGFIYSSIFHSFLSTQRYIVRRSVLEKAGRWNPTVKAWNDWELGLRLLLVTDRLKKVKSAVPLVLIHAHGDSITGNSFSEKEGVWEQAVDAAEQAVRKAGRQDTNRLLCSLEYKRIMLAGAYTCEGNDAGRKLYRQVMERARGNWLLSAMCRMGYWLLCRHVRGTARIAEQLFRFVKN